MLNHVKRAESFDHLKTIGGIFQSTYQATCKALGLLGDDKEWIESLQEAIFITSSSQLRQLFVSIILFYEVADPKLLFSTFWQYMYNNIISRLRSLYQMPNLQFLVMRSKIICSINYSCCSMLQLHLSLSIIYLCLIVD
jgi:hypothetical protein